MDVPDLVKRIRTGDIAPVEAPTESDYYQDWTDRRVSSADPFMTAAVGSAMDDRLAWVFLAGYQGTLARCFPELEVIPGWRSFVHHEGGRDKHTGSPLTSEPATTRQVRTG